MLAEIILGFGPTLLLVALFIFIMRRAAGAGGGPGGLMSFGRSRARRVEASDQHVTFADVAGIDEAKEELTEIVDFLKNPDKYLRLGGRIPRGVLLSGAPGTGKTLLARAVAGEAGVPFFQMSASEFVEMIVGVGASRVRDLFAQAKAAGSAIIFIDELDAIGRSRAGGGPNISGGHDEREQTLNQILTEMDGFDPRDGVIVLGATNRPEILDPALLRPGRFDRRVSVQPPDRAGREAILKVHTRSVPLAPELDLGALASSTPGMVGADLANLVNEAALLAARRNHDAVNSEDLTDALERIILGAERKVMLSEDDRRRTAYHEAGHAIVGMLTPGADPVRKVSIIPRGQALGVTFSAPDADRFNFDERYLLAQIKVALGGRAAEETVFGDLTTGAESDIQHLTRIARHMVGRWGMSPAIGPIAVVPDGRHGPAAPRRLGDLRGDPAADRRRGAPDRRLRPRRGDGAAARAPWPPRLAGRRPARARDARRSRRLRRARACRATRRPAPAAGRRSSRRRVACTPRSGHPRESLVALDDPLLDRIAVGAVMHEVPGAVGDLAGVLRRGRLPQPVDQQQLELLQLIGRVARGQARQRLPGRLLPHAGGHEQPIPQGDLVHRRHHPRFGSC